MGKTRRKIFTSVAVYMEFRHTTFVLSRPLIFQPNFENWVPKNLYTMAQILSRVVLKFN